jgi:hypothetical protein
MLGTRTTTSMQTRNRFYVKCYIQLDKMETVTVTARTEEERPWTDRAESSLLEMYDEILVETEQ